MDFGYWRQDHERSMPSLSEDDSEPEVAETALTSFALTRTSTVPAPSPEIWTDTLSRFAFPAFERPSAMAPWFWALAIPVRERDNNVANSNVFIIMALLSYRRRLWHPCHFRHELGHLHCRDRRCLHWTYRWL